jgi:BirA family biotin operon repressor/biotin-[acetyl-CoA-carboxylase] ligase
MPICLFNPDFVKKWLLCHKNEKKMKEKLRFNIEEFDIKLDTDFVGRNFLYVDSIDSTNKFLMHSKDNIPSGTLLLAEEQTNGKGRKQRIWFSLPEQSLTFSILLKEKIPFSQLNILNLATAVAVAQAIENLYQLKINLKWPNDVLIDGKKVAGILLESSSKGDHLEKVVIGIGININQPFFKGSFSLSPTSIRLEFGKVVSREKFLSEFLNIFEELFLDLPGGNNKILTYWRERCRMIGEKIKVVDENVEKYGVFEDIDDNGYLLLKTADGTEKISYGDIS